MKIPIRKSTVVKIVLLSPLILFVIAILMAVYVEGSPCRKLEPLLNDKIALNQFLSRLEQLEGKNLDSALAKQIKLFDNIQTNIKKKTDGGVMTIHYIMDIELFGVNPENFRMKDVKKIRLFHGYRATLTIEDIVKTNINNEYTFSTDLTCITTD